MRETIYVRLEPDRISVRIVGTAQRYKDVPQLVVGPSGRVIALGTSSSEAVRACVGSVLHRVVTPSGVVEPAPAATQPHPLALADAWLHYAIVVATARARRGRRGPVWRRTLRWSPRRCCPGCGRR